MGALALWLKSKFLGNSLAWIFIGVIVLVLVIIVIPNYSQIMEKFGIETRTSLKLQVEEQKDVIKDVVASNESLQQDINVKEVIQEITDQTLVDQANALEAAHKDVEKIVEKKQTKIRKIKKTYKAKPVVTAQDEIQEANEISQVQIETIWATYCNFNSNQACQVPGDIT